ncbi:MULTISPECIES: hypothetical protein [Bacillales]|uniref:hypothetical protein n=1 Tax=Bacillales TaxID=1385 RepID=UPI0006A7C058|nr:MULTISPECIES: hypothetical protein [Bacillales]OBZ11042.1 hypothetical protein A7975_18860 [Bacillus sp. FJAT-26390]
MYRKSFFFVLCCAILWSAGIIAKPTAVYACSCAMSPSPENQVKEALRRDTSIFAGKVTEVIQPPEKKVMSSADLVQVNFEVSTVWKGELGKQTTVYTAMSSASCGYEGFEVGQAYIVTAIGKPVKLETNICDLTKPLASAKEEIKLLGDGYGPQPLSSKKTMPTEQVQATGAQGAGGMPLGIIAIVFFIMTVIVTAIQLRRRRLK